MTQLFGNQYFLSPKILSPNLTDPNSQPYYFQAAKGILSAGAVKTVKYSAAKLRKMYKSLK